MLLKYKRIHLNAQFLSTMKKIISYILCILTLHLSAVAEANKTVPSTAVIKPFQLALFYPAQIPLPEEEASIQGLRLNILYGISNDVRGVDIGPINRTHGDFYGFGLGGVFLIDGDSAGLSVALFNTVGGDFEGFHVGGANIVDGDFSGGQIGLINVVRSKIEGLQVGLYNKAKAAHGLQVGLVNQAESLAGLQIGLFNINHEGDPLPFMPFVNWSPF